MADFLQRVFRHLVAPTTRGAAVVLLVTEYGTSKWCSRCYNGLMCGMWQPLKSGGGVEVSDAGDDAADGDVATGVQGADLSKVPRSVRRAAFVGVSLLAPHRRVDGGRGESYHNRRCNNAQCTRASHREPNATRAIADNARRLLAGDRLDARRTAPRAVLAVLSNPSATHEPRDVARAAFFAQAAPS
jgi:hypothetical protein